jgi:hypothetical protein
MLATLGSMLNREQTGSCNDAAVTRKAGVPKSDRCEDGGSWGRRVVHLNNGTSFYTNDATDLHSEWTRADAIIV